MIHIRCDQLSRLTIQDPQIEYLSRCEQEHAKRSTLESYTSFLELCSLSNRSSIGFPLTDVFFNRPIRVAVPGEGVYIRFVPYKLFGQ